MLNAYPLNTRVLNYYVSGIAIDSATYTLIDGALSSVVGLPVDVDITSAVDTYFGRVQYLNIGTRISYSVLNRTLLNTITLNANYYKLRDGILIDTDMDVYLGGRRSRGVVPVDIVSDVSVHLGRVTPIVVDINCGTQLCTHLVVFYDCYPRLWLEKKCKRCPVFP